MHINNKIIVVGQKYGWLVAAYHYVCIEKCKGRQQKSTGVIEKAYNVKKIQPACIYTFVSDGCIYNMGVYTRRDSGINFHTYVRITCFYAHTHTHDVNNSNKKKFSHLSGL